MSHGKLIVIAEPWQRVSVQDERGTEIADGPYEQVDTIRRMVELYNGGAWTSVEDKMPEDRAHVLAACNDGDVTEAWWSERYREWYYGGGLLRVPVTHWMPMPKGPLPPQPKEGG